MLGGCESLGQEKVFQYEITLNAHSAVRPAPNGYDWWMPRHNAILDRNKQGRVGMIFIGDSITHAWENKGKDVWQQYYAKRNAVNMGFTADRTQHVLWRLQNGAIAGINPKVAVILIGVNNSSSNDNTAKEIGEGIIAICQKLRADLPDTKILILSIFPLCDYGSPRVQKDAEASELASAIADNRHIYYLDINEKFLGGDGTATKELLPDCVHPNEKGYQVWAEAMEPTIVKLMGEK